MRIPTAAQLLQLFTAVEGTRPIVRDIGALESAVFRPTATVFGQEAYPTDDLKVAALMDAISRSHPLSDGNKRLALLAAVFAFRSVGRERLSLNADQLYDLVVRCADQHIEIVDLAAELAVAFVE